MKLYLVVRADLSAGLQAAQLCHALRAFVEEHAHVEREWFERSNTLVCLSATDDSALAELARAAEHRSIEYSTFHEPDLGGALTALALGPRGKRLCRRLKLC